MCRFISVDINKKNDVLFIPEDERYDFLRKSENPDSHSLIAERFGYKGAEEDSLLKFEVDPVSGKIELDEDRGIGFCTQPTLAWASSKDGQATITFSSNSPNIVQFEKDINVEKAESAIRNRFEKDDFGKLFGLDTKFPMKDVMKYPVLCGRTKEEGVDRKEIIQLKYIKRALRPLMNYRVPKPTNRDERSNAIVTSISNHKYLLGGTSEWNNIAEIAYVYSLFYRQPLLECASFQNGVGESRFWAVVPIFRYLWDNGLIARPHSLSYDYINKDKWMLSGKDNEVLVEE